MRVLLLLAVVAAVTAMKRYDGAPLPTHGGRELWCDSGVARARASVRQAKGVAESVRLTRAGRWKRFKVLRVIPKDESDVAWIQNLELHSLVEIWNSLHRSNHPVDVMVTPANEVQVTGLLADRGLDYTVMIADVQAQLDSQAVASDTPPGASTAALADFQYDIYHTYDQIQQWVSDMATEHNSIVSKFNLAKSYEGRDINGIKISTGVGDPNKPIVWFEGGIHAREWISPATVMFISKSLVEDYNNGVTNVVNILDGFDFHIIPSLNVDGFVYTHTNDRLWRKTRSDLLPEFGCIGADPNRNWPYEWGGSGSSPWPCTNIFRGREPLSEVEIRAVVDYLTALRDSGREIKMFIDWHSYSQLWMAPWSFSSAEPLPPDADDQDNLGAAAVAAIEKKHGTKYVHGASARLLYEAAGASCDWAYATLGAKYSYVVELRDTGKFGFVLPPEQILPTAEESYAGIVAGLEYALTH
ncbi:carboxypeptidase B-like [Acanthaster planci]|uniref:Carboxypeptidase B-like n=1 Tax=Acanthaster planci TaxID=133434 RepID=A0A8B7YSH5_ACAPL|nr:carboxypeptidase B-like [Acanthaster planci]